MKLEEILIRVRFPFQKVLHDKHFGFTGGSVSEWPTGKRKNRTRHLTLFGWHILTIHLNEYKDRTDIERADEYLKKWSECEKELRGFRLLYLGDSTGEDVKKVIKESWGIDLDEGTIK